MRSIYGPSFNRAISHYKRLHNAVLPTSVRNMQYVNDITSYIGSLVPEGGAIEQVAKSIKDHPLQAASIGVIAYATYLIGDHLIWSPLRNIPGPTVAKLSRFYMANMRKSGKEYKIIEDLHRQYGRFVRIGPNTVSISDRNALKEIYSTQHYRKSDFYNTFTFKGAPNIFSTTDPAYHNKIRRIMSPSFSVSNISGMEGYILDSGVIALVDKFDKEFADKPVEVNMYEEWHYMAFDIIGELAFGQSFGLIQKGYHPFTKWLGTGRALVAAKSTFPILNHFPEWSLFWISPKGVSNRRKLFKFAEDAYAARRSLGDKIDRRDLMALVISSVDPETGERFTYEEQIAESLAFVIAGTDTTSNTLTNTIYLLCEHPDILARLQEELDRVMPDRNAATSYKQLGKENAPLLWAVLMESMRVRTVLPSGLPRIVPKGGRVIAGQFIPGGTEVSVNPHLIHYDPDIFPEPEKFLPDRWLSEEANEMAKFHIPFSIGPRMCIGKNIAWMEATLALAHFVRRFDFKLAHPEKHIDIAHFFLSRPNPPECNVFLTTRP
ncbi:hypothetical protein BZG36_03278 [Bifiguratus adelaidae]|uniref:Benzoate 4-monooxygenase n=1 Tax=Bifiguratus adelaidae TaxID=1938954 RepID=A0A261XZY6_9FUNG|nr:hypothetical protein BZG36_03278 [Bifiguratus adelaidae]